jgi:putative lipoprotein
VIASLVLSLQLYVTADRPGADRWLGPDKVQHYAASAVIEGAMYGAFRSMHMSKGRSLAAATVVTIAAGVGKELVDRRRGFTISAKDLAWDVAGVSSVVGWLRRGEQKPQARLAKPGRR